MKDFDRLVDVMKNEKVPEYVHNRIEDTLGKLPDHENGSKILEFRKEKNMTRSGKNWLKLGIVAAACAGLVITAVSVPFAGSFNKNGAGSSQFANVGNFFTLTAKAAGVDLPATESGRLFFSDQGAGEEGFTGLLFAIDGEGIKDVTFSIDKGGFYTVTKKEVTEEQLQAEGIDGIKPYVEDKYTTIVHGADEDGKWIEDYCEVVGPVYKTAYDKDLTLGFYVDQAVCDEIDAKYYDLAEAAHATIDTFDGAVLKVDVTYEDGSTGSQSYTLKTGKVGCTFDENGNYADITGEFVSDGSEGYIYGILAE